MRTPVHAATSSRAFTLAELMIVLIILGVVLSVVLPSLSATSKSAQRAATVTLMSGVSAAATAFSNDHQGQNPGYFTAKQMGSSDNEDQGFAGLMNMMLDLMPGVTTKPATTDQQVIEVGPGQTAADGRVNVDLTQLGSAASLDSSNSVRSYYRPDPKYFFASVDPAQRADAASLVRGKQVSQNENHYVMPTLHDAFGQPILGWQEDDRTPTQFAAMNSGGLSANAGAAGTKARFYWASNACFLKATSLGKQLKSQVASANRESSLLGGGTNEGEINSTLEALLGNPAFPATASGPTRGRGPIVLHSAGANGVYVGSEERGAIIARGTGGTAAPIRYIPGFDQFKNGDFDDIVLGSGN